jgi:hypothetical protein
MSMTISRRIALTSRPKGTLAETDFDDTVVVSGAAPLQMLFSGGHLGKLLVQP